MKCLRDEKTHVELTSQEISKICVRFNETNRNEFKWYFSDIDETIKGVDYKKEKNNKKKSSEIIIAYGDFETFWEVDNSHSAYQLFIYLDRYLEFNGEDCAKSFIRWIEKQKKYHNKHIKLYFHNAGYDFSFLINNVFCIGEPIIKDN